VSTPQCFGVEGCCLDAGSGRAIGAEGIVCCLFGGLYCLFDGRFQRSGCHIVFSFSIQLVAFVALGPALRVDTTGISAVWGALTTSGSARVANLDDSDDALQILFFALCRLTSLDTQVSRFQIEI
jgi:hypothetical protein